MLKYLLFILAALSGQAHSVCVGLTMHSFSKLMPLNQSCCPPRPGILPELDWGISGEVPSAYLLLPWLTAFRVVQKRLHIVLKLLQIACENMERGSLFSTGSLCLSNCVKKFSAVISVKESRTPSCPLTWSCEWCYEKKGWSFSVQVTCIVVVAHRSRF